jgi:hypothetical protein
MQTLFDIAGIQARIHRLTGRPPFMTAADLADVYGTGAKRLAEAVKRNPLRFREKDCFRLTEAETAQLKSQSATSMMANRDFPMAFTHSGAYGLSFVLTSPIAIQMGHVLTDAFVEMEAKALADARSMVARLHVEAQRKKPIYGYIAMAMQKGLTLDQMHRGASYPRWKLEQAAREMVAMRLADRLPDGMQPDLFGSEG